jgi:hypothetical protein
MSWPILKTMPESLERIMKTTRIFSQDCRPQSRDSNPARSEPEE